MPDTLTALPPAGRARPRHRHVVHRLFPVATSHPLASGPTALGRKRFPDDPVMSAEHAEISVSRDQIRIRDLGSKNGTWRRGVRIGQAALADGDVFRLGDSFFLYRLEPVDPVDATVPGVGGVSPAMRALRADLARVGPTRATVMLLGETGTGKTLAARALHALSQRRGDLVQVNCAAIPEAVAESMLFGHKAGAFTDAKADVPGLLRAAHQGTLLLDEVGLLSPGTQGRLLLALETGRITPVGATTPVPVDLRVVAATNEDLTDATRFRPDLYARLAEITVRLPPLRDRREDILPLLRQALGDDAPQLAADAVDLLLRWHWPFNAREVEKVAIELRIRGQGLPSLGAELLADRFDVPALAEPDPTVATDDDANRPPDAEALEELLRAVGGNVSELARRVGRSTKQIYRWCARYGLEPSHFRA